MIYSFTFVPPVPIDEMRRLKEITVLDEWEDEYGGNAHIAFRDHTFRMGGDRPKGPSEPPPILQVTYLFIRDPREGYVAEDKDRELAGVQLATTIVSALPRTTLSDGWWMLPERQTVRGEWTLSPEDLKAKCRGLEEGWPSIKYFGGGGYYEPLS